MKNLHIRKLPDEDYAWVQDQAERDGVRLEFWLRRFIREMRLGGSPILLDPAKNLWPGPRVRRGGIVREEELV